MDNEFDTPEGNEGNEGNEGIGELIRYGVSDELIGLINSITDSTKSDGTRKFSKDIDFEFKKTLLVRIHNRPIWWLSHLIASIEHVWAEDSTESALIDFLWGQENVTSEKVRAAFKAADHPNVSVNHSLQIDYPDGEFKLHLKCVPLLLALLDLLIFIQPNLFQRSKQLGTNFTVKAVDELSKELRTAMNAFLSKHLQPDQQKRKGRRLLEWVNRRQGTANQHSIDDQMILDYWLYAVEQQEEDFKMFNSVAEGFFALITALETGQDVLNLEYSMGQGDEEHSQTYPNDQASESAKAYKEPGNLDILKASPFCYIKFISDKDMDKLLALERAGKNLDRFALTLARMSVFGTQQIRVGRKLNKGGAPLKQAIDCGDVLNYRHWIAEFSDIKEKIIKTEYAVLHILIKAEHPMSAGVLIGLLPEELRYKLIQQLGLKTMDQLDHQKNQQQLIRDFNKKLPELALKMPELNQQIQRAKSAYEQINRDGFKSLPETADAAEPYAEAYQLLENIIAMIDDFTGLLQIKAQLNDETDPVFCSDRRIFQITFNKLYGSYI